MIERIAVICTGNICRSPMGEALLRHNLAQQGLPIVVESAGTHALVGEPAHEHTRAVLRATGLELENFRARQCTWEMATQADLLLAMEDVHRQWLFSKMPELRGRVHLFGKLNGDESVPDPYGQPITDFARVRVMLEKHSKLWSQWLADSTAGRSRTLLANERGHR